MLEYEKQEYLVTLNSGEVVRCWPNAGTFLALDKTGRLFSEKDIAEYKPADDEADCVDVALKPSMTATEMAAAKAAFPVWRFQPSVCSNCENVPLVLSEDRRNVFCPKCFSYTAMHGTQLCDPATYQKRVDEWMKITFNPQVVVDVRERAYRWFEEALELVQALGLSADTAHRLVEYTYSRPASENVHAEVGDVVFTFATLCTALHISMLGAGESALAENWHKIQAIQARQAAKIHPEGIIA